MQAKKIGFFFSASRCMQRSSRAAILSFFEFIATLILVMLAQFCAILLFLWTRVSARILALVLHLYERNKLKLKPEVHDAARGRPGHGHT